MELRISQARSTKDIDLTCTRRIKNESDQISSLILNELRILARADLHDYFDYQIGGPIIDLENAPYGGSRYSIAALIDKKIFVRFHLDVGMDFLLGKEELIQGGNWLEFCQVSAPTIPMISLEQQFAEKLHAYSLPREGRTNSRVKDLVDMILLLNLRMPALEAMIITIEKVFELRATHPLPAKLEEPPMEWRLPFEAMITECGLQGDMETSYFKISSYYDSLLNILQSQ